MPCCCCGRRRLHSGVFKLLDATAAHAHQMVVVAMVLARQLKAPPALRQLQLFQQAHAAQQPQGAVHRR